VYCICIEFLIYQTEYYPAYSAYQQTDGSFGGLVFIGLRADYFTEFYQVMDIGEDNLISVTDLDLCYILFLCMNVGRGEVVC